MKISAKFTKTDQTFSASFGEVHVVTEPVDPSIQYEGDYTVTPKVGEQTLPTAEKYMEKDVTILAIPFYETSNTSNGKTVYIAKEI